MSIAILPAAVLTLAFGFILGYIPGLNEHLHWNLWYVVPISGLAFGCAAGGMQFLYCFKSNQKLDKYLIFYLCVMALVGFAAVDYGIYKSIVVPVQDVEGIEDGEYKLSEFVSFWEFTKMNLGGSTIQKDYGGTIEMGSVTTTIPQRC